MLLYNHIKHDDYNCDADTKKNQSDSKFLESINNAGMLTNGVDSLPNASNLIADIKLKYADNQYRFNLANQPVTTRYPNRTTEKKDEKYLKYVKKNIETWNRVYGKNEKLLSTKQIKLILVMETEREFLIKVNVQLIYLNKTMHLELTYYGQIEKTDDFLNGGNDIYTLQLIEIRPISKDNFCKGTDSSDHGPFMSMKEQMAYVDKINKLHQEEDGN